MQIRLLFSERVLRLGERLGNDRLVTMGSTNKRHDRQVTIEERIINNWALVSHRAPQQRRVMAKSKVSEIDLDQALSCPTCVFRRPEDVVEHPILTRAQKIDILRRWVYDATELAAAENEGMGGDEAAEIDVVMAALDRVKAG